jgi:nucleoside-diphosphate-sugar epimerase
MRVLVTGANGFVGRALCGRLAEDAHAVVPAVRGACGLAGEVIVGNIDGEPAWRSALGNCDAVVHLAARVHVMHDTAINPLTVYRATNTDATLNLARQAAKVGAKRFVYLSSIKVNGEATEPDRPFHADDPPVPEDAYAISKYEAEQGLMVITKETGMEVVIIRSPLVYGPGVKGNFASLVKWVRKGLPLPFGALKNKRSLVALDNLVSFIALCADREKSPTAANKVFLISDGEDVSTTELLHKVARAYGVMPLLVPVPVRWVRLPASLLGKGAVADRLLGSLVVDSSKARELLGWRPVLSMDEQLKKMALYDSSI